MKFWKKGNIQIFNEDFLLLAQPSEFVELIITSPPYNIGIDYGKYDDNKTYKEYLEFTKKWLAKSYEILKDNGRICINVPIDTHSTCSARSGQAGKITIASDLTQLARRAGFKYKATIIWNKQNSSNKHSMVFSKNVEVILVLYKDCWIPVKKEYKEWVNNIWTFNGENPNRVNHPAAFPMEIPHRLIKMFTEKDQVVFDPFSGSGTTMAACVLYQMKGIGVEIDQKYFENSVRRIEERKW